MNKEQYFLSLWAQTDSGEKVHPYKGVRGAKKGLYSVSFSGKSDEYEGISDSELIAALELGRFVERGTIRMLPLNAQPGAERSGFAPTHYKGIPIAKIRRSSLMGVRKTETVFPDEISSIEVYKEGTSRSVLVNAFERSSAARAACIRHYGPVCAVCSINFERVYGDIGLGFIHVHHTKPIASIGAAYEVDPINDLVPVCPNCHAMLHRNAPPLSVEELKTIVREAA